MDVKGYSTREVSEALGFPASTILAWARGGLITPQRGPRGAYVFSFQDLAVLRTARELLGAELPARRVREALERLREQIPAGRPLSAVRLEALGQQVLVRDRGILWEPATGQLRLDLEESPTPEGTARPSKSAEARVQDDGPGRVLSPWTTRASEPPLDGAEEFYDRGVELEGVDPATAKEAYGRALAIAPHHADSHLNLGRLLHEEGSVEEAETHYRAAIDAAPESARARYNLGVALEDLGQTPAAIDAYGDALRLDPELAVAHFNLSRLFEAAGAATEALRHLAAYKRLLDRGAGL